MSDEAPAGFGSPDDYQVVLPEHLKDWCPWCGDCLHCVGPGGPEAEDCQAGTDGMHYYPYREWMHP